MHSSRPTSWRSAVLAAVVAAVALTGLVVAPPAGAAPDDRATLFFIRTAGTTSGRVEIHTATAASRYRSPDLQTVTYFSTSEARQGYFQMIGRDLWFLKVCETGSGRWELHSATAASRYTSGIHIVASTPVDGPSADLPCDVQKAALAAGRPRIYFHTGERTYPDVSWVSTSADRVVSRVNVSRPGSATHTCSGDLPVEAAASYGTTYDAAAAQAGALAHPNALRLPRTGSGQVAFVVYGGDLRFAYVCAASPYGSSTTTSDRPTVFTAADASAGVLDTRDDTGDGVADVTYVKTTRTGSGTVEVFVAPGTAPGTLALASATWFSPSLAGAGTWQLGSAAN